MFHGAFRVILAKTSNATLLDDYSQNDYGGESLDDKNVHAECDSRMQGQERHMAAQEPIKLQ